MDIETQRWAQLSASWLQPPPGGFGWSAPGGTVNEMETVEDWFVSDLNYANGRISAAHFVRSITEFAAEPDAWKAVSATYADITSWTDDIFVQESGQGPMPKRVIDIHIDNTGMYNVIFVPNYGKFHRAWWWYHGTTRMVERNRLHA